MTFTNNRDWSAYNEHKWLINNQTNTIVAFFNVYQFIFPLVWLKLAFEMSKLEHNEKLIA